MVKSKPANDNSALERPVLASQTHDEQINPAILANDFPAYQVAILHEWLRTITILAFTLVPLFFVLDLFLTPHGLLLRFAAYRLGSTVLSLAQYIVVRQTKPSRYSFLHGYFASLQIGVVITLMTVSLGGFDSSYYAGLNLVIVGVNLLLPWSAAHTAANALIIVFIYVVFNLIGAHPFQGAILANNLFFLLAMAVVAVSINHVRYTLIQKEFSLLVQLKSARDALWGEMEVAKRIQTALLPQTTRIPGYEICATMTPASEVGGDYYDLIETADGDRWLSVGDVSGHGVEPGLIMMMAQTSIMTAIRGKPSCTPAEVMQTVNSVIRENMARLGSSHYMTLMLLKLDDSSIVYAGRHQDILVFRAASSRVEAVPTSGTWLGIVDDLAPFLEEQELSIADGDALLLFTDGVTELGNAGSEMFGQDRLQEAFARYAMHPADRILRELLREIDDFHGEQHDDITLVLVRKVRDPI